MIIDPEDLIEITINEKKFMIDQKFASKLVTANIGKYFTDIHRYTIDENVSEDRLKDMVNLWNDFKPDGPIETHRLLLEFVDKYSIDPLAEILSIIDDDEVTMIFEYFKSGPFGKKYDEDELIDACNAALESMEDYKWPDFMGFCAYVEQEYNPKEEREFIDLCLMVPDNRILDGRNICDLNYFRRSVHNLLSTMQVLNVRMFIKECGPVFSERLFAYSNFDIASWPAKEMHESFIEDSLVVEKSTKYRSKRAIRPRMKEEVEDDEHIIEEDEDEE